MDTIQRLLTFSNIDPFQFLLTAFIVWRLSKMLVDEDGPLAIFKRLRDWTGLEKDPLTNQCFYHKQFLPIKFLATLLCCLWCLSVWIGWLVAFFTYPSQWFTMGLVLSAGAILLDGVATRLSR